MTKPKLISNEVRAVRRYGRIKIKTSIGVLEYSYSTGGDEDPEYQLESALSDYHELTEEELDEIDDLIINIIQL